MSFWFWFFVFCLSDILSQLCFTDCFSLWYGELIWNLLFIFIMIHYTDQVWLVIFKTRWTRGKMHWSCRPYCTTTSDTASTSYQDRLHLAFNHQMFINFLTSLIKLCLWWVNANQLKTSSTKSSRIKDQRYFLLNHLKVKPCNKYHIRMFLGTIDKWVLIHICTYHTDLEFWELHANLISYLFC